MQDLFVVKPFCNKTLILSAAIGTSLGQVEGVIPLCPALSSMLINWPTVAMGTSARHHSKVAIVTMVGQVNSKVRNRN